MVSRNSSGFPRTMCAVLLPLLDRPFVVLKAAIRAANLANIDTRPEFCAVLPKTFRLEGENTILCQQEGFQLLCTFARDERLLFDVENVRNQFLRRFITEHARQGRIGINVSAILRGLENALGGIFKNAAISALCDSQGLRNLGPVQSISTMVGQSLEKTQVRF